MPKVVELVNQLDAELYTSVVCIGEVSEGLATPANKKKLKIFNDFVKTLKIIDIDQKVILEFAKIRRKLRNRGKLIGDLDILIAASCIAYNLTLVTNNKKHFKRIKGLRILSAK
jgi:predicted nucleic acid-binding protein